MAFKKNGFTRGLKARSNGENFEKIVEFISKLESWELLKIPEGCKNLGPGRVIPIKSPFDFIVSKNGNIIFFDAKTIEKGNFTHSKINMNQVYSLLSLRNSGFFAGYLIYFREEKKIKFAFAEKLYFVKKGESLKDFAFIQDSNDGKFSLNNLIKALADL